MAKKGFTFKEKLNHYTGVANGTVPVKQDSTFSEAEQRAYARGQRDARNENRRIFAFKNSTPEEREAHKIARAEQHVAYLKEKAAKRASKKK